MFWGSLGLLQLKHWLGRRSRTELVFEAAQQDLLGILYIQQIEALDRRYDGDDPTWERECRALQHRLYARFPEYAEREFRAQQAIDRNWYFDESTCSYVFIEAGDETTG